MYASRRQSEAEADTSRRVHNRLLSSSLVGLLDSLQYTNSRREVEKLAQENEIDVEVLESPPDPPDAVPQH